MSNRKMKHLAPKIYNFDAYKVGYNSLMTGGLSPPTIVSNYKNGAVCITHREYIQDISAAIDFTTFDFDINPGLVNTFPWLSQVANSYEEYEWKGLIFEFKSMSSDAVLSTANSAALGTVVMATQYNALSAAFTNKKEMANYEFANSSKPSITFIHPVECRKSQTPHSMLFVRNTDNVSGDKRLYDIGSFQIAVQGCQSDEGAIGELWVSFEICFYKPKFNEGANIPTDLFIMPFAQGPQNIGVITPTGANLGSASITGQTLFKSPPQVNGNLGGTIRTDQETYRWDPDVTIGNIYHVCYNLTLNGLPIVWTTLPLFTGLVNCGFISVHGETQHASGGEPTSSDQQFNTNAIIEITGPNPSFKVSGGVWSSGAPTLTTGSLMVTQLFGSIFQPEDAL